MKRINIIVLSVLTLLVAVSCHKENKQAIEWKTELQAVKSDLVFMPAGGSETLEVNLSSVNVTSDKAWASASVSGNVITVTVTENRNKQSRYAKLTITSGSESIDAAVIQYGEVIGGLDQIADALISENGDVLVYKYYSNVPVQMSSDADWVHFEMVDDEDEGKMVKITFDPNSGRTRFAHVSFTAGSSSGSADFIQWPTPQQVSGWDVSNTGGVYDFPNQIDQVTVTAPNETQLYEFQLIGKEVVKDESKMGEKAMEIAAATWEEIKGSTQSPSELLKAGSFSEEHENMPRSIWALVILYDEQGIPTGEYYYKDLQIPDRGPVKQAVDGWDVEHTDATWVYPTQSDVFTITPKAGYEDVKYIATVVKKSDVADVEDFAFTNFAMSTREDILAKVAAGDLPSFEAGLNSGTATVSIENAVGDVYVVVVAFGDNKFYTGAYEATEFAVADIKPAMYGWVGSWQVVRKNDKYDTVDTWVISVKETDKTLRIVGVESFTDLTRYDVEATTDEEGRLVVKTQITGSYEDSSRGHMDLLLSGQYDDTAAGKTYYTSSLNVVLFRGTLSEDGASADLQPGPINGYYFKNIQFYGRYKNSSGGTSAVSWNAGPTAIPQTITRIVE